MRGGGGLTEVVEVVGKGGHYVADAVGGFDEVAAGKGHGALPAF